MKALFAYYTGTGNTKRAMERTAEAMTAAGFEAEWHEIRGGAPTLGSALSALGTEDLLVLGFPALGFSAPHFVIRELRALPRLAGLRAAVLCACGATHVRGSVVNGWSGTAVPEAVRILLRKGARPVASAEASYPENWTQFVPPDEGLGREAMLRHGDSQAAAFGARLAETASGTPAAAAEPSGNPFLRRGPAARILGPLIARLFRTFGRVLLARLFTADGSCTACGLCERACPSGAIRMRRGRPAWNLACSACNRCINICPERAIQTSNARLVLVLGTNVATAFLAGPAARLIFLAAAGPDPAARAAAAIRGTFPLGLALFLGFSLLQAGPLDAILRGLERTRLLAPVFGRGFTRRFTRYLAPGFKPGVGEKP